MIILTISRAELSRRMAETDAGSDDEKKPTLTRSASRKKSQQIKPPTPIVKLKHTSSQRQQINQNMFIDQVILWVSHYKLNKMNCQRLNVKLMYVYDYYK